MLCAHSSRKKNKTHTVRRYSTNVFLWSVSLSAERMWHTYCSYRSNARQSAGLKVKSERRGACKLSEGFSAWTTCTKWVNRKEKKKRRYGNPAVSMATAVLTQLLPPHLSKYTAIRKWRFILCHMTDNKTHSECGWFTFTGSVRARGVFLYFSL